MSREQFETFLIGEYEWAQGALNAAIFCGDDATGHYVCGEHIYDRQDCSECLFWAWRGWQAASKASEQQLAAVVAENAGLKDAIDSIEAKYMNWEGLLDAFSDARGIKTPATDTYLAEVRAQGVEMYASHLRTNDNGASVCKMIALGAYEFAAQLRQGAGHE